MRLQFEKWILHIVFSEVLHCSAYSHLCILDRINSFVHKYKKKVWLPSSSGQSATVCWEHYGPERTEQKKPRHRGHFQSSWSPKFELIVDLAYKYKRHRRAICYFQSWLTSISFCLERINATLRTNFQNEFHPIHIFICVLLSYQCISRLVFSVRLKIV